MQQEIIFEGVRLLIEHVPPKTGELYIAERNIGKQLLTARKVDYENGWVIAEERAYSYDLHECWRVVQMLD